MTSHSAQAVCLLKRLFGNFGLMVPVCIFLFFCSAPTFSQQTLGSLNGTVTDASGAVVQKASVMVRALATNLAVTGETKSDGSFNIADLPIGTYEVTFKKDGFESAVYPQIMVQGNRTSTVNAKLKPGLVSSTVTVEATPLLNETDTTNGYTMGAQQIERHPVAAIRSDDLLGAQLAS